MLNLTEYTVEDNQFWVPDQTRTLAGSALQQQFRFFWACNRCNAVYSKSVKSNPEYSLKSVKSKNYPLPTFESKPSPRMKEQLDSELNAGIHCLFVSSIISYQRIRWSICHSALFLIHLKFRKQFFWKKSSGLKFEMYIHEIIIDGFKSYAKRTVISGFDPQFNAITGLNGTGKSNILDAICFVLGITKLAEVIYKYRRCFYSGTHYCKKTYEQRNWIQVRAGNLQELVYKQGQAGVTKASVTIVFNNSDASSSPMMYVDSKQITVTRQVSHATPVSYAFDAMILMRDLDNNPLLHF